MKILKLSAATKDYLWGGTKLKEAYHKTTTTEILAETWELSCHPDGPSIITNETYKDKTLAEYIKENKESLGTNCERFKDFPILIKFIDAKEPLSLQVHPDDYYALKNENQYGKTEVWYVLDCEPGAYLYYGFKKEVTKEAFKEAIDNGTLENLLNKVEVQKGDVFFIQSRTIHAIGGGITIAEIQQNSNVTYRVYDYNRVGADGKKRELHIEKAQEVTALDFTGKAYNFGNHIASCDIFEVDEIKVEEQELSLYAGPTSFHSLVVLEGEGKINELSVQKGDSLFVPADFGHYTISGSLTLLKTIIPEKMTYSIGVDIGGTTIKMGLVDKHNNIVAKKVYPTKKGWENVASAIIEGVENLLEENGIQKINCKQIGIGCPGTVDLTTGMITYSNNLEWENVDLKAVLERKLKMKVAIANDADCAALGEAKAGFSDQYKNVVLLTLGTGVGGGIILNHQIMKGGIGCAELGHTLLIKNGKTCSCGRKGCLEAYASATALIHQAQEAAHEHKDSKLYEMCQGDLEKMNGKIPFDAAKAGDKVALEVIDTYTDYLADGMIDMINIFRPEALLIGGGISKQEDYLVSQLKEKIIPNIFGGATSYIPEIACAMLGNDAGMIGAANLE